MDEQDGQDEELNIRRIFYPQMAQIFRDSEEIWKS
jgi:hypothetical protein